MNGDNFFLSMEKISYSYDQKGISILNDLSVEIPAGSVTSLLGLNGSGKTTLLLIILGYLKPNSGKVFIRSDNNVVNMENLNGSVGYLPQMENIPFDYPINEFIMFGRSPLIGIFDTPKKEDFEKIQIIQKFLNLTEISHKRLFEISGGELQRVRIARTISQNPLIVLMDEPMTHLDIKHKQYVSDIMRKLADQGKIVIYSSHDPADAIINSDFCILLSRKTRTISGKSKKVINETNLSRAFEMDLKLDADKGTFLGLNGN